MSDIHLQFDQKPDFEVLGWAEKVRAIVEEEGYDRTNRVVDLVETGVQTSVYTSPLNASWLLLGYISRDDPKAFKEYVLKAIAYSKQEDR